MLFGNTADFAIEADVEPDLVAPSAVWGAMRILCAGVVLGDFENRYCSLFAAYRNATSLLELVEFSWNDVFLSLSPQDTWNHLDGLIYGYHGDVRLDDDRDDATVRRDVRTWERYCFAHTWGEPFDGFKSFLVAPPGEVVWIFHRATPDRTVARTSVSRAGLASALAGFLAWFRREAARLSSPVD